MIDFYDNIKLLDFNPHGGFSEANEENLNKIFKDNEIRNIIEIGSWFGKSTRFLASKIKEPYKVYAIDDWIGHPEQEAVSDWSEKIPNLYQQFLSNVIHSNLQNKIIPIRASSMEASKFLKLQDVDLIFIDASHKKEDVENDILNWISFLSPKGIMCGDDWGVPVSCISEGVVEAVTSCAAKLNKKVVSDRTFWMYEDLFI